MKKIALIGATGKDWWTDEKKVSFVKSLTPSGYEILNYTPRHGTHSVESHVDEAYNAPFILEQVVKAEKDDCDAVIIDCACDPILDAAREASSIPVIGPRNAGIHVALTLGRRFSIVTVSGDSLIRCMHEGIRKEGVEEFCASVRALELAVLDIAKYPEKAQKELEEVCKKCIQEDGADVIVLGCTGLSHEIDIKPISKATGIPIIDPLIIAIKLATVLIESGLSHSKVAYPKPPKKPLNEPESLVGSFDDLLKE